MANLVDEIEVHIQESAGSDYRSNTSFGLAGQGTGRAKFCDTDYYQQVRVYDDLSVQLRSHGRLYCPSVLPAIYDCQWATCPQDFSWVLDDTSHLQPSSSLAARPIRNHSVDATSTVFDWPDMDTGWYEAGHLWDYGASDTGTDGYMWVSGTTEYRVDDPVAPVPVRVTVPGFMRYMGYYPWARCIDGTYKSCNRDGGSLTVRRSGSWGDCRNNEKDHSVDKAHYYTGGTWKYCPEIGAK